MNSLIKWLSGFFDGTGIWFLTLALFFLVASLSSNGGEISAIFGSGDPLSLLPGDTTRVATIGAFIFTIVITLSLKLFAFFKKDPYQNNSLTFLYLKYQSKQFDKFVYIILSLIFATNVIVKYLGLDEAPTRIIAVNGCAATLSVLMSLNYTLTVYRIRARKFGYNAVEMGELVYFASLWSIDEKPPSSSGMSGSYEIEAKHAVEVRLKGASAAS